MIEFRSITDLKDFSDNEKNFPESIVRDDFYEPLNELIYRMTMDGDLPSVDLSNDDVDEDLIDDYDDKLDIIQDAYNEARNYTADNFTKKAKQEQSNDSIAPAPAEVQNEINGAIENDEKLKSSKDENNKIASAQLP